MSTKASDLAPLPSPPVWVGLTPRRPMFGKALPQPALPGEVPVDAVGRPDEMPGLPPLFSPLPLLKGVSPFAEAPADAATQRKAAAGNAGGGDFTDRDLREAIAPLFEGLGGGGGFSSEDPMLEPLMRAAVRRALAEYSRSPRPFAAPDVSDRLSWRLQALFTSRTYEEILFDKTHRYQVDEVYLLDVRSLALISFASSNPARHASVKRVEGSAQRVALQLRDDAGKIRPQLDLPDERKVLTNVGEHSVLVAVIRGTTNELLELDLEYARRRIESRFRGRLAPGGPPLMLELQPYLEDCLLLQAPASAA